MRETPRQSATSPGYTGHAHFWERALSRRRFLITAGVSTLGLMAGSRIGFPELTPAAPTVVLPKPIPGGFHASDFGITIPNADELFHFNFPLVAPGNDPITITDFHGFIAATEIQGSGTISPPFNGVSHVFFDNDMRFMQGHYVGVDGQQHEGTFGFF